MPVPFDPAKAFHPFDKSGNRVRIAGHQTSQTALGQTLGFVLDQSTQRCELIGREASMGQAPPKSLIQAEPGMAQQNGKPSALGSIDGWRLRNGLGRLSETGHGVMIKIVRVSIIRVAYCGEM
jgi:hypothetical protein